MLLVSRDAKGGEGPGVSLARYSSTVIVTPARECRVSRGFTIASAAPIYPAT